MEGGARCSQQKAAEKKAKSLVWNLFLLSFPSSYTTRQQLNTFNMPRRAASPTASENDFDITKSLFQDDSEGEEFAPASKKKDVGPLDAGGILDLEQDSDDGDEAFIAAQQAASNRKASNVKGKSVKKGGGFQAMGKFSSP